MRENKSPTKKEPKSKTFHIMDYMYNPSEKLYPLYFWV